MTLDVIVIYAKDIIRGLIILLATAILILPLAIELGKRIFTSLNNTYIKVIKTAFIVLFSLGVIYVFIPSKDTIYLIMDAIYYNGIYSIPAQ